jgi:glycosyltransferase involved in cell wall biosynthesis
VKIALVVPEYPPFNIGGGGVVFQALAEVYAEKHDVRVFTGHDLVRSNRIGLLETVQVTPTLRVLRYPLVPMFRSQAYMRSVPPPGLVALNKLRRDLVEWEPDVAHLHGIGYGIVDVVAWLLNRRNTPYILTNHGLPITPDNKGVWVRGIYGVYRSLIAGRTLGKAGIVSGVSKSAALEIERQCGYEIVVIPNGISRLPVVVPHEIMRLRRRFHLDEDEIIVAAAGRLTHSKGFDVLVSALKHLPDTRVVCVIAGDDGGELGSLIRQSETLGQGHRVVFTGRLDRRELSSLLSLAAAVVIPSRSEPFGLVALEAMSVMCRVIASDVDGLSDVVSDGVSILVKPGDPWELARAITRAIGAGELSEEERRIVSRALGDFDWYSIGERYLDLLAQVAHG